MTENFIPFELAVKLKELGFDQPCFCIWNREKSLRFNNLHNPDDRNKSGRLTNNNGKYPAPLWQQAFHFFREKYKLIIMINPFFQGIQENNFLSFGYAVHNIFVGKCDFNTYEEARLACLQELIKIVEDDRR